MSMNLSLPLSGFFQSIKGYYCQNNTSKIIEDISSDYRVLGSNPSGYAGSSALITNFRPDQICINAIDIPIPIHKQSLVSASLSFYFESGIAPVYSIYDPERLYIDDWRTPIIKNFPNHNLCTVSLSTQSGSYAPIFDIYSIKNTTKIYSNNFNINTHQNISLSVTDQIKYHTDKPGWIKNNRLILFLSGVPTGLSGGGVIDLRTITLNLTYNPVVPFAPQDLIVSETAYKQLSLSWNPPLDNGGDAITEYNIQYSLYSGAAYPLEWNSLGSSNTTSFRIDNLLLDTSYVFKVAGRNSVGIGQYTENSLPITISRSNAPVTSLTFNDANYTRIRLRRATLSAWSGNNPILALGEAGYELDTNRLKVGDGISHWNTLSYVKVDNNSITFPPPPDTKLFIASSPINTLNNDRIILNLSSGDRLNIIGTEGVNVEYSNTYQRLTISSDKLYNPINFGTIINPTNSGTPGSLLYDHEWLYFCVANNYWQRSPLDRNWLDIATMTISNNSGSYASNTNIVFDKTIFSIDTDGDPYPALAGRPLVNDGLTPRLGFIDMYTIIDQNYSFKINYRSGSNTSNPMKITHTGIHGIMNNGVIVLSVSAGSGALPHFISAPSGFSYNAVANSTFYGADECGGYPDGNGVYRYRDGRFLSRCWKATNKVYQSNSYYSNSHYSGDHFRHTDGHSKILGFCFDGYPIYGPFSYTNNMNSGSSITRMTSSYSGIANDSHRPINWKYWNTITVSDIQYSLPMGTFIEDYQYIPGYGTLDQYNGRYGVTPDYPSGTYAYYLTFADNDLTIPAYPYIFGTGTKEQRVLYSV